MGSGGQVKQEKKKLLLFCLILFGITVVSGVVLWLAGRYDQSSNKAVESLEEFLIDDTQFAGEIAEAAQKYDLPPQLVKAVIKRESRFNPRVRGKAGEIGLMQILPSGAIADWARVHKCPVPPEEELFKVSTNLEIGCWYLSLKLKKWKGYRYGMELALAEYNAGAKNSSRWKPEKKNGEVMNRIDFPQTKKYVEEIMHDYREYLIESKRKN